MLTMTECEKELERTAYFEEPMVRAPNYRADTVSKLLFGTTSRYTHTVGTEMRNPDLPSWRYSATTSWDILV